MRDAFDFVGDVCPRCRHTLHEECCPACGWRPQRVEGPMPPHEPDDVPLLDDYRN